MIRLGLCCIFRDEPIKFRTTTATAVSKMDRTAGLQKINDLCTINANSLYKALQFCHANGIGNFRVSSTILPLKTHPILGYKIEELPEGVHIVDLFKKAGEYAKSNNIRTCFHPSQFVVLNSLNETVVNNSIAEIEYQSEVADWINADVVNIHGGGAYGDKEKALSDFARSIDRLSERARSKLTVENDDKTYTPSDLLPVCANLGIPLLYDVHHHRCNKDGLTIDQATEQALTTWNREPMFHISSPIDGWTGKNPERHHDFINISDFPDCWKNLNVTVELEAKAKEVAIIQFKEQFDDQASKFNHEYSGSSRFWI
jgi:UV DNA damage endonuclease